MKKVGKKKIVWENMGVWFISVVIIFCFLLKYICVMNLSFCISGNSCAEWCQGLWPIHDEVHEGDL